MLLYGKTLKLFMLTLKQYIDENDKNENRPFLKQSELEQIYDQVKDQTISEVNYCYIMHMFLESSNPLYYINSFVVNQNLVMSN